MLEALTRDSLIGMTGGFIVWSLYFVAVYAWLSVGCVAGLNRTGSRAAAGEEQRQAAGYDCPPYRPPAVFVAILRAVHER